MATMQEAVRRLTVESTSRGVSETTEKLRGLGQAHAGVAVESQRTERATQSMEKRLNSIQRQYDVNFRSTQTLAKVERDLKAAVDQGLISQARKNELMGLAAARYTTAGVAASGLATRLAVLKGVIGGMLLGSVTGLASGALGILSGGEFVKATSESEKALAQLDAVIKSTGGAAGFTTTELANMATELQKVTTFGDEAIMSAQGLLLTFTRIGKDVFPDALTAILNVSTAMGQDLKASTVQIGKALNDPIAGLSALGRVGIQFTKDQKEQIKTMQQAGDVMGAQRVILKELEVQFGGSATAARDTLGGALAGLKNAFGDLFEVSGPGADKLNGAINRLTDTLSSASTRDAIQSFGTWLFNAFAEALDAAKRVAFIWNQMKNGDFSGLLAPTDMEAAKRDLKLGIGTKLTEGNASRIYEATGAFPTASRPRSGQPSGDTDAKANEYERATKSIQKQTEALQIQIETFGLTTEAGARYRIEQELLNAAKLAGITIGDKEREKIAGMADAYAAATAELERLNEAQRRADEINNAFRDSFKGLVSEFRSLKSQGVETWQAFEQASLSALNKLTDKLLDMAMNNLWEAAFPTGKGSGGGFNFLSLLGLGGTTSGGNYAANASGTATVGSTGMVVGGLRSGGMVGIDGVPTYIHPAYYENAAHMRNGGMITDDGIPIVAHPGERVLNRRETADYNAGRSGNAGGISVQINNYKSDDVETRQRKVAGPNGEMLVVDIVAKHMARGTFDDPQRARFGVRPQKVK